MTEPLSELQAALAEHYRVDRAVGAGGMATVYVATDLRHDREVAIKVLRPEIAGMLGPERFLREITTTAKLQHPHILPLFDSGSANGIIYYVMPYIDGETLRARLDRETQLSIDDAVRITREVADALDYAHRKGVIHRDIKPANILLHDGRATVADFGIALAVTAAAGGRMTETGIAVGTPHYMSPEQAAADREPTARSDIYSLAVLLFEMLTGMPPHQGASAQQVIMRIATEEAPPVTSLRKSVPAHVADAIAMALQKVPADRFARARDFADALANPAFSDPHVAATAAPARAGMGNGARLALSVGIAALAAGVFVGRSFAPASRPAVARFAISLPDSASYFAGNGVNVARSPDGSRMVYVGRTASGQDRLFERVLDQLAPRSIPGTDAARVPTFSPDGAALAFTAGGALKTVSLQGGPAFTVVPGGVPSAGGGIAWGDDDQLYFVNERGAIQRVSPAGGTPTTVAAPKGETGFMWIDALPGTRHLLATIGRVGMPEASEVVAVSTTDGSVQPLVRGTMGRYATSGHLVYATADGALMAVPFNAKGVSVTDKPTALFRGVDVYMGSASQFALSRAGGLVWVGYGGLREMLLVDRRGVSRPADSGWVADIRAFALSPDGTRLLVTTGDVGGLRVGIKPLDRGPLTPLALEGTRNVGLAWTNDGRSIGVLSDRDGVSALWRIPADGAGRANRLPVAGSLFSAEWSADGGAILATRASPGARSEIVWLRPGIDSAARVLVSGSFLAQYASLSPDGRWLAYSSNETGRDEVYVRPFPASDDGKWQLSPSGGIEPAWAPRGGAVYYRAPSGDLVTVTMTTDASGTPRFSAPQALFRLMADENADGRHYQIMPDEQHVVLLHSVGGVKRDLMLVENFVETLVRRGGR